MLRQPLRTTHLTGHSGGDLGDPRSDALLDLALEGGAPSKITKQPTTEDLLDFYKKLKQDIKNINLSYIESEAIKDKKVK